MFLERSKVVRAVTASALVATFAIPPSLVAEASDHLVSPSELAKATIDASQKREQNLESLRSFLSSDRAQQAIKTAHMNPEQITKAVASLSDEELAQLAQRANKAQADFAAGYIGDRDLLIILVAIAALILIIVAVR